MSARTCHAKDSLNLGDAINCEQIVTWHDKNTNKIRDTDALIRYLSNLASHCTGIETVLISFYK